MTPHYELTASRIFDEVERTYGVQFPSVDEAPASERVSAVLRPELARVSSTILREQFRKE